MAPWLEQSSIIQVSLVRCSSAYWRPTILGTDANEAAVKLSRQYQQAKGEDRSHFISREQSYHGAGGFSLALSGHRARREQFEPMINMQKFHKISSCFDYLQRDDRTIEQFVSDKKEELERKFGEIGHGKVAAFFCETIVGAVSTTFWFNYYRSQLPIILHGCRLDFSQGWLHNISEACMLMNHAR